MEDFNSDMVLDPVLCAARWRRVAYYLRELATPSRQKDYPYFCDPEAVATRLRQTEADVALLYWDTWFEFIIPAMPDMPFAGYLARPPTEAGLTALSAMPHGLRRWVLHRRLIGRRRRHLRRASQLRAVANICAIDAAWYSENGVPCSYIPNTWPDAFGSDVIKARRAAEATRSGIHILGNIGNLSATGNGFGLTFTATKVVPILEQLIPDIDWTVNICGSGRPTPEVAAALDRGRIVVRGFVPDIDDEVISNHIFLLCNNAGPHTGGYTRVVFVMSSAGCLIAHKKLAESMPELEHDVNCLLGGDAHKIAELIALATKDEATRHRIGAAARQTYESEYAPDVVAARLADLARSAVKGNA